MPCVGVYSVYQNTTDMNKKAFNARFKENQDLIVRAEKYIEDQKAKIIEDFKAYIKALVESEPRVDGYVTGMGSGLFTKPERLQVGKDDGIWFDGYRDGIPKWLLKHVEYIAEVEEVLGYAPTFRYDKNEKGVAIYRFDW